MRSRILEAVGLVVTLVTVGCSGTPEGDGEQLGKVEEAFTLGPFEFYDINNQCVADGLSMHCCPGGYVMAGIDIAD